MNVSLRLSKREVVAILKAELSVGHGVRKSLVLQQAECKLRQALYGALNGDTSCTGEEQGTTTPLEQPGYADAGR